MQLFAIGINHHTAPLALRERIVFPLEVLGAALGRLRKEVLSYTQAAQCESAILSTCNRTEVYLATPSIATPEIVIDWLCREQKIALTEFVPYCYELSQVQVARHLFRVASGLDSMVLGETQILGQLKQAINFAKQSGTVQLYLNQLFQRALATAKAVRGQTEIGMHSVSLAAAAVRLAQRIFADIAEQNVLFIGAGEMINLCAMHFCAQRPRYVAVANRSKKHADYLATRLHEQGIDAHTLSLDELPQKLEIFDIVISCTASMAPIIHLHTVKQALRMRHRRPVFMVDLAVPRDIDATVAQLEDVFLYTLDDLGVVVREGNALRQAAVQQAEVIIESHLQAFAHWLEKRSMVPMICEMRQAGQLLCQYELKRAQRLLANGSDPEEVMERLATALTNKFLHAPTHALSHARSDQRDALLQVISNLLRQSTYSEL